MLKLLKHIAYAVVVNLFLLHTWQGYSQLSVTTSLTPTQLVQNVLVGSGVTVNNVNYSGSVGSIGYFSTGSNPTNLGISSGIIISTGSVNSSPAIGSPAVNFLSGSNYTGSDPDLQNLIPSYTVYDASVLTFNFKPLSDTIEFKYVFSSEEYPEYVFSGYNDVFGFFITGPNPLGGNYTSKNIALIPGTSLPVTIDNINSSINSMYYVDNEGINGMTIVFDGFTTVLTAWCVVVPCSQYQLKIAIGDAGDDAFDSAVFLEENSFSTNAISISTYYSIPQAGTDAIEGCNNAIISFKLPSPTPVAFPISYSVQGTAINGTDYSVIPTSVSIPAGQDSVNININPLLDGLTEGTETVKIIVQTSLCGDYDTITINIKDNQQLSIQTCNDTTLCGGQATIWGQVSGGIQPYNYSWSDGTTGTNTIIVSPSTTTVYTISGSDLCGSIISDNITVYSGQGDVEASDDVTICAGTSTTLTATNAAGYIWSNGANTATNIVNPAVTTTYFVTGLGTCSDKDSVTVYVMPAPTITAIANPTSIDMGDPSYLNANGGNNYQWSASPPDPSLNGQQNYPSPIVSPQATTTYTVVGYDSIGCSSSASVTVIVIPVYPQVNFTAIPQSGCEPLVVKFIDNSTKVSTFATYYWDFGNGVTSTSPSPEAYYEENGTYDVSLTITNPGGYLMTLTIPQFIHVYPNPIAYFNIAPGREVSLINNTISFYDISLGNPVKWSWSFDDGDTANTPNVYHTFNDTGSYNVILQIQNEYGCIDTTVEPIHVAPDYGIFMPSAFSPNSDGKNEYFFFQGFGIREQNFQLKIFNRWGELFFETQNILEGWNGKFNNIPAKPDVYIYHLHCQDFTMKEHDLRGYFTLLR